ncbi:putative F-box/LRR-repeat protein 23 [Capsicum chinense]|nr:putative F-box/LRR-repeat protein 23 [Capsicum chinense]
MRILNRPTLRSIQHSRPDCYSIEFAFKLGGTFLSHKIPEASLHFIQPAPIWASLHAPRLTCYLPVAPVLGTVSTKAWENGKKLRIAIASRSAQLKRLRLVCSYNVSSEGLSAAVKEFPLLEELHLYYISITKEAIETIGRSCRALKSFKLNQICRHPYIEYDEEAIAIAQNMPELHHLQLFGNKMTNEGLEALLNGCPHLESLDLRRCLNVHLVGNVGNRCFQQIKHLRHPQDPPEDYGLDAEIHDFESFDEDYPSGFSDIDLISDADDYYEFSDASNYSDDDDEMFIES